MQLSNEYHHRHWHYIYSIRKKRSNSEPKQIIIGQVITVFISIIAGLVLNSYKNSLVAVAGIILLLPGLVDLLASVGGALGAKVNHRLELGQKKSVVLFSSLIFAIVLCVTSGIIMSIIAILIGGIFFDIHAISVIGVSLVATLFVSVVLFPIIAFSVGFIRQKTILNPDNILGPVLGSIVSVLVVFVVAFSTRFFV